MFDALSVVPLPPVSNANPFTVKPASVSAPAKDCDDQPGFADVLAQSRQDAESTNADTTAVALPDEDAAKEAAKDAETTKPDIAADVAALLAMMGADNAAAFVPASVLPSTPVPLPATGDRSERAGESAPPGVVVAVGLLVATTAAKTSKPGTAATKSVETAPVLNGGADESAEPPTSNPDARTEAFKTVTAATVLSNSEGEREPTTTSVHGSSAEMPAAVNVAAAGTIAVHNAPTAAPAVIASLVPTHLESPGWSKDFGQHVIRLAVDGQPAAEIHLNPPDLGPIKVSIDMKGSETTLQFYAEHTTTREALEASLPRLREIFAAGGLTLTEANVDSQPQSQSQSQAGFSQNPSSSQQGGFDWAQAMKDAGRQGLQLGVDDGPAATESAVPVRTSSSQVDLFA